MKIHSKIFRGWSSLLAVTLMALVARTARAGDAGAPRDAGARNDAALATDSAFAGDAAGASDASPAPNVNLALSVAPATLVGNRVLDLSVNVTTSAELQDAKLEVSVPPNFRVAPSTPIDLPIITKQDISSRIAISNAGEDRPNDAERIVATVWTVREGKRVDLAGQTATFAFTPEVSTLAYLSFGSFGVLLGHLVRLAMRSAASSPTGPKPSPADTRGGAEEAPPPAWIVVLVHKHLVLIDVLVSETLGVIMLLFLRFVQQPPLVAASGAWCLVTGFGLGLVASNDIASRLMPKP